MSSSGSVQSQPEPRYSLTAVDPGAGLGPLAVSVLVEGTGVRGRFYFKTVGRLDNTRWSSRIYSQ